MHSNDGDPLGMGRPVFRKEKSMKQIVLTAIVLCLLLMLLLAGCMGSPAQEGAPSAEPWPTHATSCR